MSQDREQRKEGEAHFVKALGLLDRLSQRERLWISALAEDSRGNREAAVSAYRTYLAAYPDDQAAWFRVGWTYLAGVRQYELAVEAFKRSIALNPSSSSSYVNLATAYSSLENYKEAVQEYQHAFDLSPSFRTDSLVNHEYGFVLVRLGDLTGQQRRFRDACREFDGEPGARSTLAGAARNVSRPVRAAVEHLREAVVINKTNKSRVSEYRDRLYLAGVYRAKGLAQPFAVEVQAAHRLALDSTLAPEWLRRVGKIEARAGHVGDARTVLTLMAKTAGDATAASSVNRNAGASALTSTSSAARFSSPRDARRRPSSIFSRCTSSTRSPIRSTRWPWHSPRRTVRGICQAVRRTAPAEERRQ